MEMKITIDTREPESLITDFIILQEELEKKGEIIDLKREMIDVGDVVVDDKICFERKKNEDFVSSICDGRIMEQRKKMSEKYEHKFIVFVGDLWNFTSGINYRSVIGMQASLSVRDKINFFHVLNDEGFCWLVYTLSKKILEVKDAN